MKTLKAIEQRLNDCVMMRRELDELQKQKDAIPLPGGLED